MSTVTASAVAQLSLLTSLFFFWGAANNLNDVLIKQFTKTFSLSDAQAALVQVRWPKSLLPRTPACARRARAPCGRAPSTPATSSARCPRRGSRGGEATAPRCSRACCSSRSARSSSCQPRAPAPAAAMLPSCAASTSSPLVLVRPPPWDRKLDARAHHVPPLPRARALSLARSLSGGVGQPVGRPPRRAAARGQRHRGAQPRSGLQPARLDRWRAGGPFRHPRGHAGGRAGRPEPRGRAGGQHVRRAIGADPAPRRRLRPRPLRAEPRRARHRAGGGGGRLNHGAELRHRRAGGREGSRRRRRRRSRVGAAAGARPRILPRPPRAVLQQCAPCPQPAARRGPQPAAWPLSPLIPHTRTRTHPRTRRAAPRMQSAGR